MKRIPGSIIFFLFFILNPIVAKEYYFDISVSKKELFVNETAIVTVSFFKKREIGTVIGTFKPQKNDLFDLKEYEVLNETEGEYTVDRFVYLLKAKKKGSHKLSFFGDISIFSEDEVKVSSDHRDAMPMAAAQKKRLFIEESAFNIKDTGTSLYTGDYMIKTDLDETSVIQNEPAHFEVVIEGEGDIDDIIFPRFEIENVKIFEQEPVKKSWIEDGRLYGKISKEYASVSEKSFEIPPLGLTFFSVANAKEVTKLTEKKSIEVMYDADIQNSLLDKKEMQKKSVAISYDSVKNYLYCVFALIAGFIMGKIKIDMTRAKKENSFKEKIRKSKNQKELLALLLPYVDNESIKEFIPLLEEGEQENHSFKALKKRILSKIDRHSIFL